MPNRNLLLNKKILVVDDEDLLRETIVEQLQLFGATTFEAASGNKALPIIAREPIDVVLSDVRMPDGNGVELLDAIRKLNKSKPVILMVTGYSDFTNEEMYAKGADSIFSKPFEIREMIEAMLRLLKSPKERWARKHERLPTDLLVQMNIDGLEQAISAKVLNIGRGGMCLTIDPPAPKVGEYVTFEIKIEKEPHALNGRGICRWRKTEESRNAFTIGLEFMDIDPSKIDSIIAWIIKSDPLGFIPKSF